MKVDSTLQRRTVWKCDRSTWRANGRVIACVTFVTVGSVDTIVTSGLSKEAMADDDRAELDGLLHMHATCTHTVHPHSEYQPSSMYLLTVEELERQKQHLVYKTYQFIKIGMLAKKGQKNKSWRNRWFGLRADKTLSYYKGAVIYCSCCCCISLSCAASNFLSFALSFLVSPPSFSFPSVRLSPAPFLSLVFLSDVDQLFPSISTAQTGHYQGLPVAHPISIGRSGGVYNASGVRETKRHHRSTRCAGESSQANNKVPLFYHSNPWTNLLHIL